MLDTLTWQDLGHRRVVYCVKLFVSMALKDVPKEIKRASFFLKECSLLHVCKILFKLTKHKAHVSF